MSLKNDQELANTQAKLRHLEARYEQLRGDAHEDPHVRELTMHSLKRLINQMQEEITLYQLRRPAVSLRRSVA
jgi:hypothetical protein